MHIDKAISIYVYTIDIDEYGRWRYLKSRDCQNFNATL